MPGAILLLDCLPLVRLRVPVVGGLLLGPLLEEVVLHVHGDRAIVLVLPDPASGVLLERALAPNDKSSLAATGNEPLPCGRHGGEGLGHLLSHFVQGEELQDIGLAASLGTRGSEAQVERLPPATFLLVQAMRVGEFADSAEARRLSWHDSSNREVLLLSRAVRPTDPGQLDGAVPSRLLCPEEWGPCFVKLFTK